LTTKNKEFESKIKRNKIERNKEIIEMIEKNNSGGIKVKKKEKKKEDKNEITLE